MKLNRKFEWLIILSVLLATRMTGFCSVDLNNPGAEAPYSVFESKNPDNQYSGEIAQYWQLIDGNAEAEFARETTLENVHSGEAAQRLTIVKAGVRPTDLGPKIKFNETGTYRFTVWLKSDGIASVGIAVRQTGVPYKVYGGKSAKVTPEWQAFSIECPIADKEVRFFMSFRQAPRIYWIDDVTVEKIEGNSPSP